MQNAINIKHLSREEKLRVMEAIWEDLSNGEEPVESPDWHKDALLETQQRLDSGQEKIVDWQDAKKTIQSLKF
ncbi:MAG: addiction module protein [Desulfosalsimonadaceae bacterium]